MIPRSKKDLKPYMILDVLGMVFAAVAAFNNFALGVDHSPFTESILYPYTNFLVPAANIFTFVATIVYLFMPQQLWIIFFLYMLETVNLMLTGFFKIGITLYVNFFAFFCAAGFARHHFKKKAAIAGTILVLMIFANYKSTTILDLIFYTVFAGFEMGCYILLYFLLQEKLNFLFTDVEVPGIKPAIKLPETGSTLDLHELGLTERQIECIKFTLNTDYSFKKIAEELITSESTVKKDMQDLYKFFGVKNRELLRLLLLQYTLI